VWGLTLEGLSVSSFHGTSTKVNDNNESDAINKMMMHLGRQKGNTVLGVSKKYFTGHLKWAACACMINGALQALYSELVPANQNADKVDKNLERYDYLVYPITIDGIEAFSVTVFGFSRKVLRKLAFTLNISLLPWISKPRKLTGLKQIPATRKLTNTTILPWWIMTSSWGRAVLGMTQIRNLKFGLTLSHLCKQKKKDQQLYLSCPDTEEAARSFGREHRKARGTFSVGHCPRK